MRDRPVLRSVHTDVGSIRGAARQTGASRNAVRRAVRPGARDHYYRQSALDAVEPAVRELLFDYPHMSVVDIIVVIDWRRSRRLLSNLVARLRPEYIARAESSGLIPLSLNAPSMSTLTVGALAEVGAMTVGSVKL